MEPNPFNGDAADVTIIEKWHNRIAAEIEAVVLLYPQGISTNNLLKGVCEHFQCTEVVARTALARTNTHIVDGYVFLKDV